MDVEPPKNLFKQLKLPERILTGPGPSNCSQRVLHALQHQVLGHMHKEVFQVLYYALYYFSTYVCIVGCIFYLLFTSWESSLLLYKMQIYALFKFFLFTFYFIIYITI